MDVGNVRSLTFCDVGPVQGYVFRLVSKSILLGECDGTFAVLIHGSVLDRCVLE